MEVGSPLTLRGALVFSVSSSLIASAPHSSWCGYHQDWLVFLSTILIFFTYSWALVIASCKITKIALIVSMRLASWRAFISASCALNHPWRFWYDSSASSSLFFEPRLFWPLACPVWLLVGLGQLPFFCSRRRMCRGGRLWTGVGVVLRIVPQTSCWFNIGEHVWSATTPGGCLGPTWTNLVGWFTLGFCSWRLITILGWLVVPLVVPLGSHLSVGWFVVTCGCCTVTGLTVAILCDSPLSPIFVWSNLWINCSIVAATSLLRSAFCRNLSFSSENQKRQRFSYHFTIDK